MFYRFTCYYIFFLVGNTKILFLFFSTLRPSPANVGAGRNKIDSGALYEKAIAPPYYTYTTFDREPSSLVCQRKEVPNFFIQDSHKEFL